MKRRVEMERDIVVPAEGPQEEHPIVVEDAESVPQEPIVEEPVPEPVPEEPAVVEEPTPVAEETVVEEEPVDTEVEDELARERRRRTLIRTILAVLLLLLLCCILSTCCNQIWTKLQPKSPTPALIATPTPTPETACPDGGTVVRIHVPASLSPTTAELVSDQEQTDMAGHSFEVFMYNDPDETDWNVIVESMDIAQTLCWLGPDGWHQAVKLDDIPEPGTELHNIEFLIPVDSVSGEATISVNMGQ